MIEITNEDIHKIIDDAMKNKDRYVSIFIGTLGTTINVTPIMDDDEMKWVEHYTDTGYPAHYFECSKCKCKAEYPHPYCPECGEQRTGIIKRRNTDEG